jgi:predicted DNA-binding antitoxin AbrB/MazE fold protein
MSKTINAVYENGVFRPDVPPDLPEGATVRLMIAPPARPIPLEGQTPLTGTALLELIQRIASKAKPGPPENTSENVDAILYGVKGDPSDVR